MAADEFSGTMLVLSFLEDLVSTPRGLGLFVHWAQSQQPDAWRAWSQAKGLAENDGALVADAVLAAQAAVLEGNRLALDKLTAVLETRQIVEGS